MLDSQKINWTTVARKIFEKYDGIDHGDWFQVHCPCEDHTDDKPSCSVRSTDDNILVHCQVCDAEGEHRAFHAFIQAGDIPHRKPYYLKIWEEATTDDIFFDSYITTRGIPSLPMPESIRVHDNLYHTDTEDEHITILSAVHDQNERFIALHRTYLSDSADAKLDVDQPKKMLGSTRGGHVTLRAGSNVLHIAEGLETTLAVLSQLDNSFTGSVWATLSAANMASVQVPNTYKIIHIWADNDMNGAGEKAAKKLAQRLNTSAEVFIHVPNRPKTAKSTDWLDNRDEIKTSLATVKPYSPLPWEANGASIPNNYLITQDGVVWLKHDRRKKEEEFTQVSICQRPIWVSARCPSFDDATSLCEITYYDANAKKYLTCYVTSAALSSKTQLHLEFFKATSFSIDHQNLPLLCSYLHASYEACTKIRRISSHTGWVRTNNTLLHSVYSPEVEVRVKTDGEHCLVNAFRQSGSYDTWKTEVLSNVTRCYGMSFIFSSSLAAPLFSLFNLNAIPIPLTSSSGDGKSVSVYAALSAWCHPKEVEMSGSSSLVGLKNALCTMQDVPTLIDEVQLKSSESLSSLIYDVGNSGKSFKANRDGGLRNVSSIHTTCFFTGERAMSSSVKYDGANVRMIALKDMDFLQELRDDPEALAKLRTGSFLHFGHFGPEFIKRIMQMHEDGSLMKRFSELLATLHTTDPFQVRQIDRYTAILLGISILEDLLGAEYATPLEAAVRRHWQEAVEEREPELIANRALDQLKDYVITHGTDFGENTNVIRREAPGEWQADGRLAILNAALQKILGDFDATDVKRAWKKRGWLDLTPSAAKRGFTGTAAINGRKRCGCVVLRAEIVNDILPEHFRQLDD